MTADPAARAAQILAGLGGAANVVSVEPGLARLHAEVRDPALLDEVAVRGSGALGLVQAGPAVQVLVGADLPEIVAAITATLTAGTPRPRSNADG